MRKSKQNNKRKYLIFLLMTAIFYISMASMCFAQKTDFSGSWKINLQKSMFGEAPQYTASKSLNVIQLQSNITIDRVTTANSGLDSTSTEKLVFNGSPFETTDGELRPRKMTVALSDESKTLTEYTSVTDPGGKTLFYITDTWTLIDTKVLQVRRNVKVYNGFEYTVKAIYDKQ